MNINYRKNLSRLRISAHDLNIETGRRFNIPPEKRICNLCRNGVEDEYHFLFSCQALENTRRPFLDRLDIRKNENEIYEKVPSLRDLFDSNQEKNCNFHRKVGEFCYELNEKRKKILETKKGPIFDIVLKANLSRFKKL